MSDHEVEAEDAGQAQLQEKADKIAELGYHPSDGSDMDKLDDAIEAHDAVVEEHAMPPLGKAAEPLEGTVPAGAEEDQTKAELYERAQELDIPGRSDMSKDELAAAIAEAEANQ